MRILYVCTANICRSASAERLLRDAITADPRLAEVEIRSTGTHAIVGAPGCSMAPALVGHAAEHRSTPLTAELVAWADLILTAARDHRSAVAVLDPTARTRTFTIRQAGRICDLMIRAGIVVAARDRGAAEAAGSAKGSADQFQLGDPRAEAPPLPADRGARWRWMVAEMDAARAIAPTSCGDRRDRGTGTSRRWFRRGHAGQPALAHGAAAEVIGDPDDVPDPHVLGAELHALAYEQIREATFTLTRLLREMAS